MLSSVFISGRLGELINENYRYVEIDRVAYDNFGGGKYEVDKIPVRSMEKGRFYSYKTGSLIILKGRIEMDPELGLVVVDEIHELYESK